MYSVLCYYTVHIIRPLGCCIQHIFNKDAISGGGVVDEDMSNGAYQFSVLYNR